MQLRSLLPPSHSCDQGGRAQKPQVCLVVTCSEASVPAGGDGEPCLGGNHLPYTAVQLWSPQIGYNLQQPHPLQWGVLLLRARTCLSYCFISPSCIEVSGTCRESYC